MLSNTHNLLKNFYLLKYSAENVITELEAALFKILLNINCNALEMNESTRHYTIATIMLIK